MKALLRFKHLRLSVASLVSACALSSICFAASPQVLTFDAGSGDRAWAVTTDANGSILVGGLSSLTSGGPSAVVLKYNVLGALQWSARPTASAGYVPSVTTDVATDVNGNVYAVGYAMKSLPLLQTDFGGVVASFDANGAQRWTHFFNSAGSAPDYALGVVADASGVYVIGLIADAFGRPDWITLKYTTAGVEQWRQIETGLGNTDDQPVAVKLDSAGNVIVLGSVQPAGISGPKDLRLVKRSPAGNLLWRADYSATSQSDEFPSDLAIDASGNIYVTLDRGENTNPELPSVPVTLKFDANGNRLFVLEGPGRGGSAVALDAAGNFVVSGVSFDDAGSNPQPITSKFTPAGALLWSVPVATTHLAVDDISGAVYLTKGFTGFTAMKFSAAGQLVWEHAVPDAKMAVDALVDEATGDFVITGDSDLGHGNIVTARYAAGSVPTPVVAVPTAPSSLSATSKKGSVSLGWLDNANNETGFLIELALGNGAFSQIAQVGANVKTFTSNGLTKGQTYRFRVRAYNTGGNSAYSNIVSVVVR